MAKSSTTQTKADIGYEFVDSVNVRRIFLSLDNPRHEPVEDEAEAIEYLCNKEDVLALARDIARHGLSPLERFAMIEAGKPGARTPSYFVTEGNRRICALKLLADPDLAPPKLRKSFEKLSGEWKPITSVPAVVFSDQDTLRTWLDRVHSGPQGGIGRKTWDAEQKQRFFGGSKNKLAQLVLDYAEAEQMISKEEREGKLTTAQRFLNPEVVQEAFGIDRTNSEQLTRTRPKAEFDTILRRFIRDLVVGKEVNSRKNKPEITSYVRSLTTLPGVTNTRVEPEPASRSDRSPKSKARVRKTPRKPEKARHVKFEDEVFKALQAFGNEKLESLYYSICSLELERHTPIVSIASWAFFETLTACQGRNDATSFDAFLSKGKLSQMGFANETTSLRPAITRMREYGNTTKHHKISASFNGDQLNNDMSALKSVILKCIAEAAAGPR